VGAYLGMVAILLLVELCSAEGFQGSEGCNSLAEGVQGWEAGNLRTYRGGEYAIHGSLDTFSTDKRYCHWVTRWSLKHCRRAC
jgi:hypothetical protein